MTGPDPEYIVMMESHAVDKDTARAIIAECRRVFGAVEITVRNWRTGKLLYPPGKKGD